MRFLITGGAGMVGSHATEYFAKKGNKIIVLDNLMRSRLFGYKRRSVEYNWGYLSRFKNVERIKGDIRDVTLLKKIFEKNIDVVIHAAAQPGVGFSIKNPQEDFSINGFGTFNVLEAIRRFCRKRCVFIYCSTNKVYGENVSRVSLSERKKRYIFRNRIGIDEKMDIDLTGHTPYGVSKYIGDMYAQEYAYTYGIKTGIFRMSCIYGTRQFGFEEQGWLAHFAISNMTNRTITIYGDGKQVRDVLYVEDLIKAFESFIGSTVKVEVFNIGGGPENTLSLLELIDIIVAKTGTGQRLRFDKWRPADQKVYISDITKVSRLLEWRPTIDIGEGLDRLLQWIRYNIKFFK